jgi:hypothetical protein
MEPFTVSRAKFKEWLKSSHTLSDIPGYFIDTEGEYDIGVIVDKVTIYPREHFGRSKPGLKR